MKKKLKESRGKKGGKVKREISIPHEGDVVWKKRKVREE